MNNLSGIELVLMFAVLMAGFLGIMSLMLKYMVELRGAKRDNYDFERKQAVISDDRAYFEKRLADISSRLLATEDRWRDANHLLLSEKNFSDNGNGRPSTRRFLSKFGADNVKIDPKLVMILTPFAEEENSTYHVIRDICSRANLNAVRGDEQYIKGDILTHVVELIAKSRFIIANISSRNPNVFYELGIAHALNKSTILLAKSISDTPFDIQSNRIVVYRDEAELRDKLTDSLLKLMADTRIRTDINEYERKPFGSGYEED